MGDGQTYASLVEMGKGGNRYALKGDVTTIGRGAASEIRLSDPKVSRSHARILLESGQIILEDLKSAHGVLVNGQKIEKAQLTDGDQIQLGDTHLVFEIVQDLIGTIMASSAEQDIDRNPCRYCDSPISEGEAYCSMCGSLARKLPEPFGFIQQAYLQLRALHQSGKMDAATFRTELEKMVVSDGTGGFWMVGVQSGRWHWHNGSDWIQRDPPSIPLKQAPLVGPGLPPSPPVPPPPEPGVSEAEEGQPTRRLFLVGGGTLVAFSILAIGAYAAYQWMNADGEAPISEIENQSAPISTIAIPVSTPTAAEVVIESPSIPPTADVDLPPTEGPSLSYNVRPYDPDTDEALSRLPDFVEYIEAESSPDHSIYKGSWYVQQPAIFSIGWCAIDEATLSQNLQVIQIGLEIDGRTVEPERMFEEEYLEPELACKFSHIILEFLEPGEHRLLWTTSYAEPVFDGWQTLEAGTYLNDYVFEVKNVNAIEDEFDDSSGKWDEGVQGNFSLWMEGGKFHIQVHKSNFVAWSLYHDLSIDDPLVITHAKRVSDESGAYGLIARYQDVSNFYYFIVDDTGYFTLGKRLAGDYIDLISWTASEAISSGDELNRLGITITGNELVAFINSQMVGTVSDDSFQEGNVGMLVQSDPETGEMHAEFDVFYLEYYEE